MLKRVKKVSLTDIVYSGGGMAGISYVGGLSYLEEKGLIGELESITGTSIGGIFAVMLAVGYNSKEMEKKLLEFDLKRVKDINIDNFLTKYGIDSGKNVVYWIRELIGEKLGNEHKDITFIGIYDLKRIELTLTGTCINRRKVEYFNKDTHPKARLCDAVRITMGVPIMFTVVRCENNFYNDGGILDNYPIHLKKFKIKEEGDVMTTLGFHVNNDDPIEDRVINSYDEYKMDIYFKDLMICMISEITRLRNRKYSDHTIEINTSGTCSLVDFDISNDTIKKLIAVGYEQTKYQIEKAIVIEEELDKIE